MRPSEIGAQTLTIWDRQNLQLLTSSKSGWRALVQVMLSLLHAVLKWWEHSGRPAYMGRVAPVLYRLLYRHDLPKYLRPVQISAAAYIFTISWGKIKNLTRLISVLSLHFKFVHDHKSCPNSATTLLSPKIEAILASGRGRWKLHKFSMGGMWVRGGGRKQTQPLLSRPLEAGVGRRGRSESKYVLALNATCMHVSLSHISVLLLQPLSI